MSRAMGIVLGVCLLACGTVERVSVEDGSKRAASGLSPTASDPCVSFWVTPLIGQSDGSMETDSIWSPNDHADSIMVVRARGEPSGPVELRVDVGIRPIDLSDQSPPAPPRFERWRTVRHPDSSALARAEGGRVIAVLRPSELYGAGSPVRIGHEESALQARVQIVTGDTECSGTISLLPAI